VGLGCHGLAVLRQLRKELNEEFGRSHAVANLRLLYVDTDPEAIQNATTGAGDSLQPGEVLLARLHRPSHYLRPRDGKFPHDTWLNSKLLYRIPRQQTHAGVRALGRLAFVDNYRSIAQRLETELAACCDREALKETIERTGLALRTSIPRVYLVTSLAGGTGSGMLLDFAYLLRRLLRERGSGAAEIVGLFLIPGAGADGARRPALANTVATLTELNHFASSGQVFTARYENRDRNSGGRVVQEAGAPFQRCLLLPMPHEPRPGAPRPRDTSSPVRAGHFLFCDLLTPLGRSADELGKQLQELAPPLDPPLPYQTFGTCRIVWPRRALLYQAAHRLSRRVVQHWMNKDTGPAKEDIGRWVLEQWEAQGFRPECLIAKIQENCEQALKQSPEKMFLGVIASLGPVKGQKPDAAMNMAPVVQVVDSLEKLLGLPDECRTEVTAGIEPSLLEKTLHDAVDAVAVPYEQALAELVVRLFEEPSYRLAGAEEAVRRFSACVQQALEGQETLTRELQERTVGLHQRLRQLLNGPPQANATSTPTPARWKVPFTKRPSQAQIQPENDLIELVRSFAKCRYQSLVLQHLNRLYVGLRGHLSDQMREIGFCRTRLKELADLLKDGSTASAPATDPTADQMLLPHGADHMDDAVTRLEAGVGGKELLDFDLQIQGLISRQFRALVNVCMASSSVIRDLAPAMVQEAEAFLEPRLEVSNVAEMFLARYSDDAEEGARLDRDLQAAFEAAAAQFGRPTPDHDGCIIAFPTGPAGERLRRRAQDLFPGATLITSDRVDEIIFYRDPGPLALAELEPMGPAGQEAYRCANDPSTIHSRIDITEWRPAVAVS
jgi:hypothetical protein